MAGRGKTRRKRTDPMLFLVPLGLSDATPPVLAVARRAAQTVGSSVVNARGQAEP